MKKFTRFICTTVLLVLAGCTTTGVGLGILSDDDASGEPVAFSWKSTDGAISGTMTASLAGNTFTGRFFQITEQTRSELLNPLWGHWRDGWFDWPYWGYPAIPPYPMTRFVTHYSGKVVATLESAAGQRMRCRFHLVEPLRGMSGGGEGECQLSDSKLIRATFPGAP